MTEKRKEYLKEYRLKNKESLKEKRKEYCLRNKEKQKEYKKEYGKTIKELISQIYSGQKRSSKRRKHNAPTYTREELSKWLLDQDYFMFLFTQWEYLDYQKEFKPSVDRLDDYQGYNLGNIQLITWAENNLKCNYDMINGKNTKTSRSVKQYSKNGEFIKEFYSISQASRTTEINLGSISRCVNGRAKSAGGFKWS